MSINKNYQTTVLSLPLLVVLELDYDVEQIEVVLNELNSNIKQEEFLETIFSALRTIDEKSILHHSEDIISALLKTCFAKEIRDTFEDEMNFLFQVFKNYFLSIKTRIYPFKINEYKVFVDWGLNRILLIRDESMDIFAEYVIDDNWSIIN